MSERIIGGMFGLELPAGAGAPVGLPGWLGCPHIPYATARCALNALLVHRQPARVWLPSYLCGVVLAAVPAGVGICFYPVDGRLGIASGDWIGGVGRGDVVVFIDYFGFVTWDGWGHRVRQRGGVVVEDASQALLNREGHPEADYALLSPRKFFGVPDGGLLAARHADMLPPAPTAPPPEDWWLRAFRASILRRDFDRGDAGREWFGLFQQAEAGGPAGAFRMSDLSLGILRGGLDFGAASERRRSNYAVLADGLSRHGLFGRPPEGVVPLGYPVRMHARDDVRRRLFAESIYPPVHWTIHDVVPGAFEESHRLAIEVMTLPCDQRYDTGDMIRMVRAVQSLV